MGKLILKRVLLLALTSLLITGCSSSAPEIQNVEEVLKKNERITEYISNQIVVNERKQDKQEVYPLDITLEGKRNFLHLADLKKYELFKYIQFQFFKELSQESNGEFSCGNELCKIETIQIDMDKDRYSLKDGIMTINGQPFEPKKDSGVTHRNREAKSITGVTWNTLSADEKVKLAPQFIELLKDSGIEQNLSSETLIRIINRETKDPKNKNKPITLLLKTKIR